MLNVSLWRVMEKQIQISIFRKFNYSHTFNVAVVPVEFELRKTLIGYYLLFTDNIVILKEVFSKIIKKNVLHAARIKQ